MREVEELKRRISNHYQVNEVGNEKKIKHL